MEKVDLPIYRAKKINSDEYVVGYITPTKDGKKFLIGVIEIWKCFECDKTTLEISFDNEKSFIKLSNLEMHTCTDFELKYSDMKMREKKEIQPANGSIFTVITDKGR